MRTDDSRDDGCVAMETAGTSRGVCDAGAKGRTKEEGSRGGHRTSKEEEGMRHWQGREAEKAECVRVVVHAVAVERGDRRMVDG